MILGLGLAVGWSKAAGATYSILAVDTRDGTVGGAVASCVPLSTVQRVFGAVPGSGAVMTQSYLLESARPDALALLAQGKSASDVVSALTDPSYDPDFELRQYAAVDVAGGVATFTGAGAKAHASGVTFVSPPYFVAIQGNFLTGPEVLDQARGGFESGGCDLPERLLRALQGAGSNGAGDGRCTPTGVPAKSAMLEVDPVSMTSPSYLSLWHDSPGDPPAEDPVTAIAFQFQEWRAWRGCPIEDAGEGGAGGAASQPGPSGEGDSNDGCSAAPGGIRGRGGWVGLVLAALLAARRRRP